MINTTNKLRLSCQLDRPAERVTMTLRCQTQHELPKEGLHLLSDDGDKFFADKDFENWSFPLKVGDEYFDASNLNWLEDFQLFSEGQHTFDFTGKSIRVFVDASEFGLPYLVEVNDFPPAVYKEKFWVICRECDAGFIKSFAYEKVVQIQVSVGLPNGWVMFSLK